jgi:hypothetical protein
LSSFFCCGWINNTIRKIDSSGRNETKYHLNYKIDGALGVKDDIAKLH